MVTFKIAYHRGKSANSIQYLRRSKKQLAGNVRLQKNFERQIKN